MLSGHANTEQEHLYTIIYDIFLKFNSLFEISQFFLELADFVALAVD